MAKLSDKVKAELIHALHGRQSAMFVVDGKLFSVEVEEIDSNWSEGIDLTEEIENYPELKDSLQRYLDQPEMKKYTAEELKRKRHERRK